MAQDFAAMTANSVDTLLALLGEGETTTGAIVHAMRSDGTLVMRQSA